MAWNLWYKLVEIIRILYLLALNKLTAISDTVGKLKDKYLAFVLLV